MKFHANLFYFLKTQQTKIQIEKLKTTNIIKKKKFNKTINIPKIKKIRKIC